VDPDYLVIGAGVAGLRAAIELAEAGRVLVIAKDSLRESSSEYAQGGVAVALSDEDEVRLHEEDTLRAGDGLCEPRAVHVLVEEGPAAIQQLIEWGAEFDKLGSRLAFTREGAHTRNRVLHAHGDSTGHEIARALYHKAASFPNIEFRSFAATTDLLLDEAGRVVGAQLFDARNGQTMNVCARAVLLATGGLGNLYLNTTNPEVATGDGVAIAWRAGAEIADIEFVQFHPTALHLEGAPHFLLSEALRGEGAVLLNACGEAFMERYHPMKDLAPRDVVARAIISEMERTGSSHVSLDFSHRGAEFIRGRFPRIYETCLKHGVDLGSQPAPVAPAAHYGMGGVRTDLFGRSSLAGLYAAGEAACTGVHGANRLASNSLLEGLVYGRRAGQTMRGECAAAHAAGPVCIPRDNGAQGLKHAEIQAITWDLCGIVRTAEGLEKAQRLLERASPVSEPPTAHSAEARNMQQAALLIARCAAARMESRGAHYRTDFSTKRPEFLKHTVASKASGITFC
jgi:L-aspartate oxidase